MFETAVLSYGSSTKRAWATALGFTGQALLIGCALLVPLISPQTLGRAVWVTSLATPGAPPAPPAPDQARVVPKGARPFNAPNTPHTIYEPTTMPPMALEIVDPPPVESGDAFAVVSGVKGGIPGGLPSSIIGTIHPTMPPLIERAPEPKPVAVVKPPEPVKPPRITSMRMATPIRRIDPVYPRMAIAARISGEVQLMGVLGVDGRIHELKVLRGHPMLIKAAVDAVMQWVYEPTLLNGQAVEVAAPITVNFILN